MTISSFRRPRLTSIPFIAVLLVGSANLSFFTSEVLTCITDTLSVRALSVLLEDLRLIGTRGLLATGMLYDRSPPR